MNLKKQALNFLGSVLIVLVVIPIFAKEDTQFITSSEIQIGSTESFTSIEDFTYIEDEKGITITGYIGNEKNVNIPKRINGKDVTAIGVAAFSETNIITVNIPDTVTYIGWSAFEGCYDLKTVKIPNSVTYIGGYVFNYCLQLEDIKLPTNLSKVEQSTFESCRSLKSIDLPKGVTSIGIAAFLNCYGLTEINIPSSVISIGNCAFQGCRLLTQIQLPNNLKNTGVHILSDSGIKHLTIPNTLTKLEEGIVSEYLISMEIPASVTSISPDAMYECYKPYVIAGENNSCAETFAKENNILFVNNNETTVLTTTIQCEKDVEDESIYAIKGIVENRSNKIAKNIQIEFSARTYELFGEGNHYHEYFKDSVEVIEEAEKIEIGDMSPGEMYEISWRVKINPIQNSYIKQCSIIDDLKTCKIIIYGDNVMASINTIQEQDFNEPERRIGNIYEQTVDLNESTLIPQITSVKVELVDSATNTYALSIDKFKYDDTGKPFFYWQADEAMFTNANKDFTTVECVIDKEVSGRNIPIKAYIGDGLGHAVGYTVWIKAN